MLNKIDGVSDVTDVNITKKVGDRYSDMQYDMEANMTPDKRLIMAPENVVLELKYPYEDIKGNTV